MQRRFFMGAFSAIALAASQPAAALAQEGAALRIVVPFPPGGATDMVPRNVLPEVPTYREVGHPEFNGPSWFGLVAPKSTPAAQVARVQKAVAQALQDPAVKKRMDAQGLYVLGTSSADFTQQIASEVAKMKTVAAAARISIE